MAETLETQVAPALGWHGRWGSWSQKGVVILATCNGVIEFQLAQHVSAANVDEVFETALNELRHSMQTAVKADAGREEILAAVHWVTTSSGGGQTNTRRRARAAFLGDGERCRVLQTRYRHTPLANDSVIASWVLTCDSASSEHTIRVARSFEDSSSCHRGLVLELPSRWLGKMTHLITELKPGVHWFDFASVFGEVERAEIISNSQGRRGNSHLLVSYRHVSGACSMFEALSDRYLYNPENRKQDDCFPASCNVGDVESLRSRIIADVSDGLEPVSTSGSSATGSSARSHNAAAQKFGDCRAILPQCGQSEALEARVTSGQEAISEQISHRPTAIAEANVAKPELMFSFRRCGDRLEGFLAAPPEVFGLSQMRPTAVLGRTDDCDVPIFHPFVSKQHARLHIEYVQSGDGGSWELFVQDCSSNGTWLNGVQLINLKRIQLKLGDRLSFLPPGEDLSHDPFTWMVCGASQTPPIQAKVAASSTAGPSAAPAANSPLCPTQAIALDGGQDSFQAQLRVRVTGQNSRPAAVKSGSSVVTLEVVAAKAIAAVMSTTSSKAGGRLLLPGPSNQSGVQPSLLPAPPNQPVVSFVEPPPSTNENVGRANTTAERTTFVPKNGDKKRLTSNPIFPTRAAKIVKADKTCISEADKTREADKVVKAENAPVQRIKPVSVKVSAQLGFARTITRSSDGTISTKKNERAEMISQSPPRAKVKASLPPAPNPNLGAVPLPLPPPPAIPSLPPPPSVCPAPTAGERQVSRQRFGPKARGPRDDDLKRKDAPWVRYPSGLTGLKIRIGGEMKKTTKGVLKRRRGGKRQKKSNCPNGRGGLKDDGVVTTRAVAEEGVLKSAGSLLHASGKCKPCAFFHKPESCWRGHECKFCHDCPPCVLATPASSSPVPSPRQPIDVALLGKVRRTAKPGGESKQKDANDEPDNDISNWVRSINLPSEYCEALSKQFDNVSQILGLYRHNVNDFFEDCSIDNPLHQAVFADALNKVGTDIELEDLP